MTEVIDPRVVNPLLPHFTNMLILEDPNPYSVMDLTNFPAHSVFSKG